MRPALLPQSSAARTRALFLPSPLSQGPCILPPTSYPLGSQPQRPLPHCTLTAQRDAPRTQWARTPTAPCHTVTAVWLLKAPHWHILSPHAALRLPERRAGPNFSGLLQGQMLGSAGRRHGRKRTALRRPAWCWAHRGHRAGPGVIGNFLTQQQNRIHVGHLSSDRGAMRRSLLEGLWEHTIHQPVRVSGQRNVGAEEVCGHFWLLSSDRL